jgi:hypothetical protein
MIGTQNHIINKVFLEVNTQNIKTANDLKDNMNQFLIQDIFPLIEQYFNEIESSLPSEIVQIPKINLEFDAKSGHNFYELKQLLKDQVIKEVKKVIKNTSKNKAKVTFISQKESDLKSFLLFLENGTNPWYYSSQKQLNFNTEELKKLVITTHFKTLFKEKIISQNVKKRLINQFSDTDIFLLLQSTFSDVKIQKLLFNSEFVSKLQKALVFRYSIWIALISYFNKSTNDGLENDLIKILNHAIKIKNSNVTVYYNLVDLIKIIIIDLNLDTTNPILLKHLQVDSDFIGKKNDNDIKLQYNSLKSLSQKSKTNTDKTVDNKAIIYGTESDIQSEKIKTKQILELDSEINSIKKTGNQSIKKIKNIDKNLNLESLIFNKKDQLDTTKTLTNSNDNSKTEHLDNDLKELDNDSIGDIEVFDEELISAQQKRLVNKLIGKANDDNLNVTKTINALGDLSLKNETIKAKFEAFKKETLESLNQKQNKVVYDDKSDYYVENAGLILMHPFLTQLFENCDLLDSKGTINDEELAVHLLHYLATKKEKQFESQMVFEKFLCGVPIKKSIRKDIEIPIELKNQVEELLEYAIQSWEIIKKSSSDLLRYEFLQRSGKLSLKGDNPKVIIERKTQDILLDKLPWNLSICKLKWRDKIIFTDW